MHRLGENPAFVNGGNAFGATPQLGTTDANALEVYVSSVRALRIEPPGDATYPTSANVIGGGSGNSAAAGVSGATIGGGGGSVASGGANTVQADFGTVAGGVANSAGIYSTVAGGVSNSASGDYGTVLGGGSNTASAGYNAVLGGGANTASGYASLAAGLGAQATFDFSFVWSGWALGGATSFSSNQFQIGADHGLDVEYCSHRTDSGGTCWVVIGDVVSGQAIATSTGAYLSSGGIWTNNSDRTLKTDFTPIDAQAVLAKVVQLPIDEWRYKSEEGQRHLGPVAQDFYSAFGLGADEKHITTLDEGGVALAAIKGLNAKVEQQQRETAELRERVQKAEAVAADVVALKASLAELQRGRETVAVK